MVAPKAAVVSAAGPVALRPAPVVASNSLVPVARGVVPAQARAKAGVRVRVKPAALPAAAMAARGRLEPVVRKAGRAKGAILRPAHRALTPLKPH